MTTSTIAPALKTLAPDLKSVFPRSPRAMLGGYVIVARIVDKCRATLNGTNGEYNFNCPLDRRFFDFTGINANDFMNYVATGAPDENVGAWVQEHSIIKEKIDVVRWNNEQRYMTIDKRPDETQLFFEELLSKEFPDARIIFAFDVLDFEEGRLTDTYKI